MESQTIDLGPATLAALQALIPPRGMTPLAWVVLGIGLGQLVLLTVGLVLMHRSTTRREQQTQALALATAQRHEEARQRHDETMARHDETWRASDQQHTATMRAFDQRHTATMRALEALIERTAPPPPLTKEASHGAHLETLHVDPLPSA